MASSSAPVGTAIFARWAATPEESVCAWPSASREDHVTTVIPITGLVMATDWAVLVLTCRMGKAWECFRGWISHKATPVDSLGLVNYSILGWWERTTPGAGGATFSQLLSGGGGHSLRGQATTCANKSCLLKHLLFTGQVSHRVPTLPGEQALS